MWLAVSLARALKTALFTMRIKLNAWPTVFKSNCKSQQLFDTNHVFVVDEKVQRSAPELPQSEPLPLSDFDEVETIIKNLHNKKAPGPDNISIKVIKLFLLLLISIFDSLLEGCAFPGEWGKAIVVGKPGKLKDKANWYQPFNLLNSLDNIYERILLMCLKAIVKTSIYSSSV